jgi:hypothetical protein
MPMRRVRALRDNVTTQNATLMEGQVGECPEDRAKVLVGRGEVELVEGELHVPTMGVVEAARGDRTERATGRKVETAEHQTKKG